MKRTNYFLFLIALLVIGKTSWAQDLPKTWISGGTTCILTADGTFTVSVAEGQNGVMADYPNRPDWTYDPYIGSITSLVIEEGVKVLGQTAFLSFNVGDVTLPQGLQEIHTDAFRNSNLTSITIPNSVTNIATYAFYCCDQLAHVYCYASADNISWGGSYWDFIHSSSGYLRTTQMHVYPTHLADYQSLFGETLNVTFVGDLPLSGNWTDEGNWTTPSVDQSKHEITINSEAELAAIAYHVNVHDNFASYYLTNAYTVSLAKDLDFSANYWIPIGTDEDHKFEAQFNGNGHTIKGINVNRPSQDYNGLFGYAHSSSGSVIRDFTLKSSIVSGRDYTGGVIGYMRGSVTMYNVICHAQVDGQNHVGGMSGYAYSISSGWDPSTALHFIPKIQNSLYLGNQVTGSGNHAYILGTNDGGQITNTYYCCATASSNSTDVRAFRSKKDVPSSVSVSFSATNGISYDGCFYAPDNETVGFTVSCNDLSKQITDVLVNGTTLGNGGNYSYTVNSGSATEYVITVTLGEADLQGFVFQTAGNWNDANNWKEGNLPTATDDVIIIANATIPNNCVAYANAITINTGTTLTIEDGSQLIHNNADVVATVKKNITGYTADDNGWYFIASPTTSNITPTAENGLLSGTYDLYYYNEPNYMWKNHKTASFNLNNAQGYLYGNAATNTELQFTGALLPSNADVTIPENKLTCQADVLTGFNLVGNPFACNATLNRPYYIISGGQIVAANGGVIQPCEGVMVQITENDKIVTFVKATGQTAQPNQLQITVAEANTRNATPIDNAILCFDESRQLEKFTLDPDDTKLYIPQGNKDYTIAASKDQGEMPLNFVAKKDGQYTIMVSPENVVMSYLHLIDSRTGADVDLLVSPTYTFTAKTTDYASRFRLVFACGDADDDNENAPFAFINNGNIIANGEGTLQVVDMMGHIIICRDARSFISTDGMTPGVYVLRLIQGENVKTQKIVIQ